MQNARLDDAQVRIKVAERNINNLRYVDDTTPYGGRKRGAKEPLDDGKRRE